MKNTGIIRRLDALGRVVIPREYRKLMKIELGDPLEILAVDTGEITIKKVDMTAQLIGVSAAATDLISDTLYKTAIVSDFETYLTGSGSGKNNVIGRNLPSGVIKKLKERRAFDSTTFNDLNDLKSDNTGFSYFACAPIMSESDCFGGLFVFSNEPITDADIKTVKIAAGLMGASLQKY